MSDKETAEQWMRKNKNILPGPLTDSDWEQIRMLLEKYAAECTAPQTPFWVERSVGCPNCGTTFPKRFCVEKSDAAECTAPQTDLLQTIQYLLLSWSVFYAKLPDGEYDGLGEMRTAVANLKNFESLAAASKAGF